MAYHNRNKNELLTLTGAVYAFVAYLTAFTLEVLFIIDLVKRNSAKRAFGGDAAQTGLHEQAKLSLDNVDNHVTIPCLAISILYFILFVASLILIIALIVRSTFLILTWMCIMTTMYLPEFGLIIYVSVYGWGLGTRNGRTELIFYLLRAALNVIFIFRAHRLFKDWSYEKNFFMLKSGSRFTGYDSPYFIGDSLSTTINPIFSASTLNLDRYEQFRDSSNRFSPTNNTFKDYDGQFRSNRANYHNAGAIQSVGQLANDFSGSKYGCNNFALFDSNASRKAALHSPDQTKDNYGRENSISRLQARQNSVLSINDSDDYADFEMDLDYRTLTNQRHYITQQGDLQISRQRYGVDPISRQPAGAGTNGRSPGELSYSTQSLDRRQLRDVDLSIPEQVILRPLGHEPFEYLKRPGSSSNLNSTTDLNTQPSSYSSNTKLAKRSGLNLNGQNRFL